MISILPCGDCAVSVRFEERIDPAVNAEVTSFAQAVEDAHIPGVIELVPSYCALLVRYDPIIYSFASIKAVLEKIRPSDRIEAQARTVELPVCYLGEYAPDIEFVAQHAGLSASDVALLHSASEYRVYMLGFTPGFPYLGGMDPRLAAPRLDVPRTKIPAGSVGIAGEQTGVYPLPSPGGWQLIGRTPLALYDPMREEPFMLRAGDTLRFVPIGAAEYRHLAGEDAK